MIVHPGMVGATEELRVAAFADLFDGKACIVFGPRVLIVHAQARTPVATDVVERPDFIVLAAHDDNAFAEAEFEHEIVTRLGNSADVIRHQPEILGECSARLPCSAPDRDSTRPGSSDPRATPAN